MPAILIKKYSNRRLYDTSQSSYVTLDELAEKIRLGADVRVIDAKTKEDLTQTILAQIILESRGTAKLLPSHLLVQLIRMEDDALSEFFTQYMAWALTIYQRIRRGADRLGPFNPMNNPLAQMFSGFYGWPGQHAAGQGGPGLPGLPGLSGLAGMPPGAASAYADLEPPPWPGQGARGSSSAPELAAAHALAPEPDPDPELDDPELDELSEPPDAPAPELAAKRTSHGEPGEEVAAMRRELDELKELLKAVALGQQQRKP